MSFILDALKKSESERHRHSGPVLMDVRVAPPRRRIPTWAWVIAAVLLVNLMVLAWLLWLSPAHKAGIAPAATPAATAPAEAPAAATPATASPAAAASVPPPAPAAPPPPAAVAPVETPAAPPALPPPMPGAQPAATAGYVSPQNIDVSTLPKVADMLAAGVALPELRLSLHVYDAAAQSRYVLLNGSRLREGEFTPEGVRVTAITPTGVVVEWRGRRMFLGAGG